MAHVGNVDHFRCSMFVCKFIISFYDNGAQKNLKISYNNKLPHYRDFYNRTSKQQNNKADL